MVSRSVSFGPTAGTADTKTTIGSAYTFASSGKILKIRYVADQATADIGLNGILYLDFKRLTGPFEFAVGMLQGKATAGEGSAPVNEIDTDIPYQNGEVVTVSVKTTETSADNTVSLTCVE